jgi:hypothetical protein
MGVTAIARQIAELVERVRHYELDRSEAAAEATALHANAHRADQGLVRLGIKHSHTDTISRL